MKKSKGACSFSPWAQENEIVSLFHSVHKVHLYLFQSKMRCIATNPAWSLYPGVGWGGQDRVKEALIVTVQEMRPRTSSTEPKSNQSQVLIRSRAGLEWCEVINFSNPSLISWVGETPLLQGFHSCKKQSWDVFQAHSGHYWILMKEMRELFWKGRLYDSVLCCGI